jgi:hypothetical protein
VYPLTTIAPIAVLVVASPLGANAFSSIQYALNKHLDDYTYAYSATATIMGGKVAVSGSSPPGTRVGIQTYSSAVGALYGASGTTPVTWTHGTVQGVQSRCNWWYLAGPVGGTIPLNCWRYVP